MEQPGEWVTESVDIETSDGAIVHGDLAIPSSGLAVRPADGAVVCHPHPQYGGDRHHPVVVACWRALADRGVTALRFDFRSSFGGGIAERLDVTAAVDAVAERAAGSRLVAVGYSFGAMVALGTEDPRVVAQALVAPPLTAMPIDVTPSRPTLVLAPAHDQFTPPSDAEPIVERWRSAGADVTFEPVPMTDHFLVGQASVVADRVIDWLGGA